MNIPLLFTLSIIPDVDIVIPFLEHRGPTHSVIIASMVFIPFFVIYGRKAIPYFLALAHHSIIGDYIAGYQTQILWPLTKDYFGAGIDIRSPANIAIEWMVFITSIIVMLKAKDITTFLHSRNSNLILAIPVSTVLLPTFLSFPLEVPAWLIAPHLAYMLLFSASIIISLRKVEFSAR